MDLTNDYLIWSEDLDDLMTSEPTTDELNEHAVIIDEDADKMVPECLLMDYSHGVGGSYYTHLVKGIGENKRYVFCFSFNGATATEPQLEACDDGDYDSYSKNVLGAGDPDDSMVKAVCTTASLPGASWTGTSLAGSTSDHIVKLNAGNGALDDLESGETSQELYANIKIVIPENYSTPSIESFKLVIRFTWN
jgi:hypothetical protein